MIIASLSAGKDSAVMLPLLVQDYGPENVIAHYQVLPEDWPETLDYNRELCARVGVQLVAQQIIYAPASVEPGSRDTQRLAIRDIRSNADIIPPGTPGAITGIVDLALRRGWPPGMSVRWCTSYFKIRLLDAWIAQQQRGALALGSEVIVALGERAGESPRRANKQASGPRFSRKAYRVQNWLPIQQWSRRQVFRGLRDFGLRPHPAYAHQGMSEREMYDVDEEGGPRISCRFCIYASFSELCHQAQMEANWGLLDQIRRFEEASGRTWWPDHSVTELTGISPEKES